LLHRTHDVAKDTLPSKLRATLTSILSCSSLDLEFLLIKRNSRSKELQLRIEVRVARNLEGRGSFATS